MRHFTWFILLMCLFTSCNNEIGEAMRGEGTEILPVQTTYNAVITYTNNGIVTSKLFSPRIDHYQTKDTSYILMKKGFKAQFFDSLGHFTSELTAVRGVYYERARIMVGDKKVNFKNLQGESLFTDKLTWYQDSARIYTDSPVTIIRNSGVFYGNGLSAAEDFSSYSTNNMRGTVYVQEDDTSFTAKDSLP